MNLSQEAIGEMRAFALTYGSAVRQRTTRQETTMARHGTVPELLYQRKLQVTDGIDFSLYEPAPDEIESQFSEGSEEIAEFDISSDENESNMEAGQEGNQPEQYVSEIDQASTFLVGRTTRFGRQVRINSRIIS